MTASINIGNIIASSGAKTEFIANLDKRNKTPHTRTVTNDKEKEITLRL